MEYRNLGYCYKHKEAHKPIEKIDSEEKSSEANIRYNIDGKKYEISSKEIDEMLIPLKKAKKYWIVDLGIDEDEFVQYAVKKNELEHWDNSKKIETKKMIMEEAFVTLKSKLGGDLGHTKWWGDDEVENKLSKSLIIVILISILIFTIIILEQGIFQFIAQMSLDAICGLILIGGGALTSLNRSDSGKFVE
ncbi:MAG: hypothetical protein CMA13_04045 [Euryarchaeota archaeon]|nr:hypothetical protein [Euryarchaeota archaeon]